MLKRSLLLAAGVAALFVTFGAKAGEWDKKTVLKFSQPVEIPGVALPAGTYVFKVADLEGNRNVVQVFNADESKIFATFLAVPHLHPEPHAKAYIGFEERPAGTPMAIHEWFYPGHTSGLEFVFPKARAVQLAHESGQPVLAAEVKPQETPVELQKEQVVEVTPENKEIQIAELFEPALPLQTHPGSPAMAAPQSALPNRLPDTASPLPIMALIGFIFLVIAGSIKALTVIKERV